MVNTKFIQKLYNLTVWISIILIISLFSFYGFIGNQEYNTDLRICQEFLDALNKYAYVKYVPDNIEPGYIRCCIDNYNSSHELVTDCKVIKKD